MIWDHGVTNRDIRMLRKMIKKNFLYIMNSCKNRRLETVSFTLQLILNSCFSVYHPIISNICKNFLSYKIESTSCIIVSIWSHIVQQKTKLTKPPKLSITNRNTIIDINQTLDHLLKSFNSKRIRSNKYRITRHDFGYYRLLRSQTLCYNSSGNVLITNTCNQT